MISIKKLVSALCLAGCFSYSSAQEISATGELITNTQSAWQGCSTAQSGAFWGGYSGGPCPGIDSSSGQIIFSYGQTTLSQTTSLATALANSGSGLLINGYNYSWQVKNSNINGSQPGNYDLTAYVTVTLWNLDGTVAQNDTYNYGYHLPGWTQFSGTRTYHTPYSLAQVDDITLSVTSRDDGFWAGYYGPEFRNFSLSVNYSMDPCAADPLYASSCPGYWEAFLQQISASSNWNTAVPMSVDTTDAATPDIEIPTITAITEPDPAASPIPGVGVDDAATGSTERERREVDPRALSIARDAQNRTAATATAVIQQSQEQSQSMAATQDLARDSVLLSTDAEGSIGSVIGSTAAGNYNGDSTDMGAARPGDPLSEARNPTAQLPQDNDSNSSTAGRASREPPSELSGGADFGQFAVAPDGFSAYATLVLRDGALYQPREIYRGQKNVDNRRSLQQLSGASDRLHQDMVDQQYGRISQ